METNLTKNTSSTSTTNIVPFVVGGVVIVGFIGLIVYFSKQDDKALSSMKSKDQAEVRKARAYSYGAVGVANALFGVEDKPKKRKR
jgi:hypothetical protein